MVGALSAEREEDAGRGVAVRDAADHPGAGDLVHDVRPGFREGARLPIEQIPLVLDLGVLAERFHPVCEVPVPLLLEKPRAQHLGL